MILKDLTYEEFKGNSAKIKRQIKKELLATGNFTPKRKKAYKKGNSNTPMSAFASLNKQEFIKKVDELFANAAKSIGCSIENIKTEHVRYGSGIVFYGFRIESEKEINDRLNKAINQTYEKIKKKFAAKLKKDREIAAREARKKREAKKQAIKIIETLGEDVYEVFDEIINKKS